VDTRSTLRVALLLQSHSRASQHTHTCTPLGSHCTSQLHVPGAGPSAPTSSPATGRSFHARAFPARTVTHARDTPSRHTRPTAAQTGGTLGRDSRAGGDRLGARGSAQAGAYKHSALSYRPKHQCYNNSVSLCAVFKGSFQFPKA
jgi:hypothetical protein